MVAHAEASTGCRSRWAPTREHAWLRVTDDGVGVAAGAGPTARAEGHLGLRTLDGPGHGMGGKLQVEDGPAGEPSSSSRYRLP